KDIIDVQLTVLALEPLVPIHTAVTAIGYTWREDITADHRPPGDNSPDSEWQKWYFAPPPNQRATHLHVRAEGKANQRYPLLFRDYLRAHPHSAVAYAALKYRLAEYHGRTADHTPYVIIKDPVCDIIISAAEDWATAVNWQPAPPDV
ncbi:MAG TPA: GrpB family protein, partial [Anaerolineae bacterium]|nr:GrpB family protein [Anaerolineae bacterium]